MPSDGIGERGAGGSAELQRVPLEGSDMDRRQESGVTDDAQSTTTIWITPSSSYHASRRALSEIILDFVWTTLVYRLLT
jgi:hypothetical protein